MVCENLRRQDNKQVHITLPVFFTGFDNEDKCQHPVVLLPSNEPDQSANSAGYQKPEAWLRNQLDAEFREGSDPC
jgi:hypothetical protein